MPQKYTVASKHAVGQSIMVHHLGFILHKYSTSTSNMPSLFVFVSQRSDGDALTTCLSTAQILGRNIVSQIKAGWSGSCRQWQRTTACSKKTAQLRKE